MDFYALRSHTYEQVVQKDKLQLQKNAVVKVEKKQMYDRRRNYSKYVSSVHVPPVSQKKSMQMQSLISGIKHPVKSAVKVTPGTRVLKGFFSKRGSRSQGYVRNPNAYQEGRLPELINRDISES